MTVSRAGMTRALVQTLNDQLVVAALGNPAYDLYDAGDRKENMYMWGAMGLASSVGLGLALAAPQRTVIVLDGDGSLLMNLGSLATIASLAPNNLVHVLWDNKAYDLTGGQVSATAHATDLAGMARSAGYREVRDVDSEDQFLETMNQALTSPGPWFVRVATQPTPPDRVKPLVALRRRFLDVHSIQDSLRDER